MRLTRICGYTVAAETTDKLVGSDAVRYFMPQEFKNLRNSRAHARTTSREAWEDTNGDRRVRARC